MTFAVQEILSGGFVTILGLHGTTVPRSLGRRFQNQHFNAFASDKERIVRHLDEGDGRVHCAGATGDDRTLCGVILEGIEGQHQMRETAARINCADCITIIEHCYRVRTGEMVITRREQR